MRAILIWSFLAASVGVSWARFEAKDMSFYCVAEVSAGITFDKIQKKWVGAPFNSNEKFVLKMKFIRTRTVKDAGGTEQAITDYYVALNKSGTNFASQCNYGDGYKPAPITVNEYDVFSCTSSLTQYLFNGTTNKYLETYVGQYVGSDDGGDTPSVTGGRCTRID